MVPGGMLVQLHGTSVHKTYWLSTSESMRQEIPVCRYSDTLRYVTNYLIIIIESDFAEGIPAVSPSLPEGLSMAPAAGCCVPPPLTQCLRACPPLL